MKDRNQLLSSKLTVIFLVLVAFVIRSVSSWTVFANGKVIFTGTDPFYHMRRIVYTTQNFPSTLTFDSYLNYPYGFDIGWPPLYDQAAALFALILGYGNPTLHTIEVAGALFPALLGALTIIPLYFVTLSISDKRAALLSVVVISLIPAHLAVSRVGAADHHVAEVLLSTTAYVFFMLSLKYGKDVSLSFSNIKQISSQWSVAKPLIFSGATGIILGLALFTWIGSPIYVGLIILFALVQFTFDLRKKISSEYLLISTATTYLVTLIVITPFILILVRPGYQTSGMFLSWFHVSYVSILLLSAIVLGALSWFIGSKYLKWWYYPAIVTISSGLCIAAVSILSPDFYQNLASGILYLLGSGPTLGMISEAMPIIYENGFTLVPLWQCFGIFIIPSVIGFGLVIRKTIKEDCPPDKLFFIVWSLVVILLTLSQRRFAYLLSINIAILTGFFIISVFDLLKDDPKKGNAKKGSKKDISKTPFWQLGAGIAISMILILVTGLLFFGNTISILTDPEVPPSDWVESLEWLKSGSPETSYYLNPCEKPEYGVLSWWDYGNWILYIARRPPVANNFQTGLEDCARYFATSNESEGLSILDKRNVRYVITDTWMVTVKTRHIINTAGDGYFEKGEFEEYHQSKEFMNTTLAKLHLLDGSQSGNLRLIYESNNSSRAMSRYRIYGYENISNVKIFEYVPGLTIRGYSKPAETVYVNTDLISNQGREFEYQNEVTANESGWYEIRVPYSTQDPSYSTRAITPYEIWVKGSGTKKEISVYENDVMEGNEIRLDLEWD